jgi:hypothetical protein
MSGSYYHPPSRNATWKSPHGQVLKNRYAAGLEISFPELVEADLLLFMIGFCRREEIGSGWNPVALSYLSTTPDFLLRAERAAALKRMLPLFGLSSIDSFKDKYL